MASQASRPQTAALDRMLGPTGAPFHLRANQRRMQDPEQRSIQVIKMNSICRLPIVISTSSLILHRSEQAPKPISAASGSRHMPEETRALRSQTKSREASRDISHDTSSASQQTEAPASPTRPGHMHTNAANKLSDYSRFLVHSNQLKRARRTGGQWQTGNDARKHEILNRIGMSWMTSRFVPNKWSNKIRMKRALRCQPKLKRKAR